MFPNLIWSHHGKDSLGLLGSGFLQARLAVEAGMKEMFDASASSPPVPQGPAPAQQQTRVFPHIPLAPDVFMKALLAVFDNSHQIWLQVGSAFPKPTPGCSASLYSSQEYLSFLLSCMYSLSMFEFCQKQHIHPCRPPGWVSCFWIDCF